MCQRLMLDTVCMIHYKEISNVIGVRRNKKYSSKYIRLQLRSLFVMSKVSKVLYTHINTMKPLPQYVHTDTAVASSLSNSK